MNYTTLNFEEMPSSERIQLVEDIRESIAEETPDQLQLTSDERVELRPALTPRGDCRNGDQVQVMDLDQAVQMHDQEIQTRRRAPMPEQTPLDVSQHPE